MTVVNQCLTIFFPWLPWLTSTCSMIVRTRVKGAASCIMDFNRIIRDRLMTVLDKPD